MNSNCYVSCGSWLAQQTGPRLLGLGPYRSKLEPGPGRNQRNQTKPGDGARTGAETARTGTRSQTWQLKLEPEPEREPDVELQPEPELEPDVAVLEMAEERLGVLNPDLMRRRITGTTFLVRALFKRTELLSSKLALESL